MCELHWGTKEKCQSSCQYTPTYRIVLPYHASRWFIHSTRNWQTTWKQWKVFAVLPACVYVLVHTSDILQNDEIWKTNSRLWLCDPTTRAQVSWFFFFDLCALTASEESVSSFIVPQVRGDKDWFYKIKISFLQQNYNALQCNIFRYPM